jgi:CO/xanthine dehydrogenase Mo-binding subunit
MQAALGIPLHKCHVQIHGCGGGHGDGYTEPHMAIAARHSQALNGHAVTYKLSRQGHNHLGTRQYDAKTALKFGVKKDGTILAVTGDWYGNGGGASGFWYGLAKTYKIPNLSFTAWNIYTNTPGRGAWRCVSDPPGNFNYDVALDKVASQLGMNPWDLRMKNLMPSDMADQDTAVDSFGRPRYWSTKGINLLFPMVYADSGYATKWHAPGTKTLPDGRLHGISITGHMDSHGGVSGATRYGHLRMGGQDNTGLCFAYVGGGKGSDGPQATMMHIAAEVMGLKYTDMALGEWANSDINLDTGSQGGSAFTGGAGSGFYNAALDMRGRLFARAATLAPFATITAAGVTKATATATVVNGEVANIVITSGGSGYSGDPAVTITGGGGAGATAIAQVNAGIVTNVIITFHGTGYTSTPTVAISGVTPNDLEAANSSIFLKSDPTKTITHAAVTSGWQPQIAVAGGWAANFRRVPAGGLPGTAKLGDVCFTTGSCATAIEVAVDADTGEVEVTSIWNYIHTGTSIFKTGCLKEIGSGCECIQSETLYFGDVYDAATGAVMQMSHGMFGHPTTLDINPAAFKLKDVENDDVAAPCGGRGIGEPCVSDVSAIECAIFNATGKWVDPEHGAMSPDKVLKALGKA